MTPMDAGRCSMKLDSVEVFVVGNPPPGFGGRYFVFLKLKTACGIEGVGEVYAATFGPQVIASMIEDVFARRFAGRDPFHIEAIWRESYGSGFTPAAGSVAHGRGERAGDGLLGHHRQGGRAAHLSTARRAVHERLRSYTYLYPADGEGDEFYHDAERSAARAAEYVKLGFTGLKFDPTGGYSVFDPRQPTQEADRAHGAAGTPGARSRRTTRRISSSAPTASSPPPVRFVSPSSWRTYDPLWFEEPVPPEMPEQMALVARATSIPDRHRRAAHHQIRVRAGIGARARPISCK